MSPNIAKCPLDQQHLFPLRTTGPVPTLTLIANVGAVTHLSDIIDVYGTRLGQSEHCFPWL